MGAAIALVVSYVVVVVLMYVFTQRLFHVPYEWRRLGLVLVAAAALVAVGEAVLPTDGLAGFLERVLLWLAFPVVAVRVRVPEP